MELNILASTKAETLLSTQRRLDVDNCAHPNQGPDNGAFSLNSERATGGSLTALFCRTAVLLSGLLVTTLAMAYASDNQSATPSHADWQISRLMTPTRNQLAAESRGQVFIYDSLDISQVEEAMDANFDRIDHMMFTRVRHPAPTPDTPAYLEDDGCD